MAISSVDSTTIFTSTTSGQPSASEVANTDKSFQELIGTNDDPSANAKQMLASITSDGTSGYWAWQIKQMREKAAAEVMGSMNLTPEKIAAMDAKDRVAIEKKIEALVEQKVKQDIAENSKKKQQQALVTSASMSSIITNAQSIKEQIATKGTLAASSRPSNPLDMLTFGAS